MITPQDHVGDIGEQRRLDEMLGHRECQPSPSVHDAEVALSRGDECDGLPRLALTQRHPQVGVVGPQSREDIGEDATHRRREDADAHLAGDPALGAPTGEVQVGLDSLEVGEHGRRRGHEVPPGIRQHDAATRPLEQRDTGAALQTLDLLRHGGRREAERVGSRRDASVRGHRPQRDHRFKIDHAAMLPNQAEKHSLVFPDVPG